jgi:hypothetical protein
MPWMACTIFSLLLLGVHVPPAAAQIEKGRYKLGLFLDKRGNSQDGDVLNAATDAFIAAHRFSMVARSQLDAVLTEKDLQAFLGGQANDKLTDLLGLDLLGIVGYTVEPSPRSQGKYAPTWIIDVRLVDVKTVLLLTTVTSNRPSLLSPVSTTPREAGRLLYQSIREAFPPLGYVVHVNDREVIIDLGSGAGLREGDVLEVLQEGKQFIHPVTGKLLTAPMEVIGKLKVLTTSPQSSACKIKAAKGAIRDANLVRLKGNSSLIVKWLSAVHLLKKDVKDKNSELLQ